MSLRVLVVDDCPDNRDSLTVLLEAWGYEVQVAKDGPSALEAFRTFGPHAVLLDVGMPGVNGWEVARRIREQEGGAAVLLVAVTGHGRDEDRERSHQAGINFHLTKPSEPNELRRLLAQASPRSLGPPA